VKGHLEALLAEHRQRLRLILLNLPHQLTAAAAQLLQGDLAGLHRRTLYQHGDAAARIQQLQLLFRPELPIGEPGLMDDLPEAIARMGKMKAGMGGGLPRVDTAKDNAQARRKDIANHVFSGCMAKT